MDRQTCTLAQHADVVCLLALAENSVVKLQTGCQWYLAWTWSQGGSFALYMGSASVIRIL